MVKYRLLVDKEKQKLYVLHREDIVRTMRCSTGTEKKNQETPIGTYIISNIYRSCDAVWMEEGEEKGYGPYICDLDDEKGREMEIAIHGTDEPERLGLSVSIGCVRVSNRNIVELVRKFIKSGTLVDIVEN